MGARIWRAHPQLRRFVRYTIASIGAGVVTFATLGGFVEWVGLGAVWSNIVATVAGTFVAFELNRRFVWRASSRRSWRRELLPFWAVSLAGLGASTLAVGLVARVGLHRDDWFDTAIVEAANLLANGLVWLVQFVLCDRYIFGPDEAPVALALIDIRDATQKVAALGHSLVEEPVGASADVVG